MNGFLKILAGLGMIASFGGAVVASVFSLAAAANSTPAQMRGVYLAIGAAIGLAALGVAASLVLMKRGEAGLAALVAFMPAPLMVAALFLFLR